MAHNPITLDARQAAQLQALGVSIATLWFMDAKSPVGTTPHAIAIRRVKLRL